MKHTAATPKVVSFLLFTSLLTPSAFAAELDDVVLGDDGGLELSITANRRVQPVMQTLAPVSVITRNDIEAIQANDVIDVLRLQQGVNISRTGGAGSQTAVFLRGSESRHSLVLLDGVRVASATIGSFDWSSISVDNIERIEIVRGARTSLYGSDAIGGIIQLFTRKKQGAYASVTLGKYGTSGTSLGFSNKTDKSTVSLNVSAESSDGFSASNEKAGAFTFDPDLDGHTKKSINAAVSHQLTDNTTVGVDVFYSNNLSDYDQGENDTTIKTLKGHLNSKISERWSHQLTLSQSENNYLSTSAFGTSPFDTSRQELNWQNNFKLSGNTDFVLGANYLKDKGKTNDIDDKISNKAIYASLLNKVGKLNLDLSARYDDHSQAGSEVTGQLATGYSFTPSTTAYVSYGTAFRAPNINDLYYPGFFGSFAGNPDLTAETSKSFEMGLKSRLGRMHSLEASLFRTKVDDMITFTGPANQAENSDNVTLKGLELSYRGNARSLNWGLGATIQRAEDSNGEALVRRPNNKFTANLGYKLSENTRLGIDAVFSSSRIDNDFSTTPSVRTKLGSYDLINLSASHKLSKRVNIGLRVENLTDEDYELAHGFNTPGRSAYLTLSYK